MLRKFPPKIRASFHLGYRNLEYKPLVEARKQLGLSKKDLEELAASPIAINQLRNLSGGFIPNFAKQNDAEKRALKTEKSYGAGAILDEYRGMKYVRQPGQSSNFKTMI